MYTTNISGTIVYYYYFLYIYIYIIIVHLYLTKISKSLDFLMNKINIIIDFSKLYMKKQEYIRTLEYKNIFFAF